MLWFYGCGSWGLLFAVCIVRLLLRYFVAWLALLLIWCYVTCWVWCLFVILLLPVVCVFVACVGWTHAVVVIAVWVVVLLGLAVGVYCLIVLWYMILYWIVLVVCCDCLLWFDCVLLICCGFVYLYCKFVIVFVFAGWFVVAGLLDLLLDVCWFNSVVLCGSLLVWGVKFAVIAHCGFVAGSIDLLWF